MEIKKLIYLDIVSIEELVFSGYVKMVSVTGVLGEIGIIYGHSPLLTNIKPGEIRIILKNNNRSIFYISGGILEIQPNYITILSDIATKAENLNEEEININKRKIEKMLLKKELNKNLSFHKLQSELLKITAQIKILNKIKKKFKHKKL